MKGIPHSLVSRGYDAAQVLLALDSVHLLAYQNVWWFLRFSLVTATCAFFHGVPDSYSTNNGSQYILYQNCGITELCTAEPLARPGAGEEARAFVAAAAGRACTAPLE
jgi:hypothetical protein